MHHPEVQQKYRQNHRQCYAPHQGNFNKRFHLVSFHFLPLQITAIPCFAFAFLLLATQFLSLSFLFFAVASPCLALPLLIKATPCIHSLCCAAHVGSMQFHCSSEPCFAMPLQILSNQRIAVAAQIASSPGVALAFLSQSSLCRCRSTPSVTQPYPAIAVN